MTDEAAGGEHRPPGSSGQPWWRAASSISPIREARSTLSTPGRNGDERWKVDGPRPDPFPGARTSTTCSMAIADPGGRQSHLAAAAPTRNSFSPARPAIGGVRAEGFLVALEPLTGQDRLEARCRHSGRSNARPTRCHRRTLGQSIRSSSARRPAVSGQSGLVILVKSDGDLRTRAERSSTRPRGRHRTGLNKMRSKVTFGRSSRKIQNVHFSRRGVFGRGVLEVADDHFQVSGGDPQAAGDGPVVELLGGPSGRTLGRIQPRADRAAGGDGDPAAVLEPGVSQVAGNQGRTSIRPLLGAGGGETRR